jgi:Spy/CpxP family protein refolding chaperone
MAHSGTRVALLLLLTFAAGVTGGLAVDRYVLGPWTGLSDGAREGGGRGQTTIERFADDLGLTDEQRADIKPILEDTRKSMMQVWDQVRPEYDQVVDSARARIEAVLTAEQVARYRELLERQHRKNKEE